jgi:hypothetical protein
MTSPGELGVVTKLGVTVSVPGTFHAFNAAEQLYRRGALEKVYTTYPWCALDTSLPRERVVPIRHPELIARVGRRLPLGTRQQRWFEAGKRHLFDSAVARRLSPTGRDGLFVGFAGVALRSLDQAAENGYMTAVERSSSHARTQKRILDAAFKGRDGEHRTTEAYVRHEESEYERADHVIVPSAFVRESFRDHGVPESKVVCIPFGIDPSPYDELVPGVETGLDGRFVFLFMGRVGVRKGISDLLEAWDRLDLSDAVLAIAGEVTDEMMRDLARWREDDSVRVLGWVDNKREWFRRASVFVFPSLEEGSAIVTYEAMAAGLPLVTTFESGWVGEDGEHGIEVPSANPDALAAAMERLHAAPDERRRMGERSYETIREGYTLEAYEERLFACYNRLVDID